VAVDGSKANASKHKAMSYGRRQQGEKRLRKEIRERMGKARKPDTQEDKRYGQDRRGDEVPAELSRREDRLQKIQEARKYLEARQVEADRAAGRDPGDQDGTGKPGKPFKRPFGEPPAKAQENCTDPDSRLMKRGGSGFEPCYNVQIAVDETERIVVATAVTQSASDIDPLIPLFDAVEENLGAQAGCYLADAGDRSESKLQALEERGIDGDGAREGQQEADLSGSRGDRAYGAEASHEARREELPQTQADRRAAFFLDPVCNGLRPIPFARAAQHDRGMGSRVFGCEPAPDAA
jgi:hypothetical protein